MLLRKLKLNNIRSYADQTIEFPEGSTLLSGDIGCGKSSLLLAIEFALFGTARPDLPAEHLLRKGSTQGSVELTFSLAGEEITINRQLKKEREAIKQTAGYVIKNNIKKELTPVELKAEVITLLGYPDDALTKSKNYIFRYTVYTPQEAMKEVLQEDVEIRLDVLRRIFNIDKYKNIRENIQIYLKQLRVLMEVLQTKTEPLEQERLRLGHFHKEKEIIEQKVSELTPELVARQNAAQKIQEGLFLLEQKQKVYVELTQQLQTTKVILAEKNNQLEQALQRQDQLRIQLAELSLPEQGTEDVGQQIAEIEKQKKEYLTTKTMLQGRVTQLQLKIQEIQQSTQMLSGQLMAIEEKEKLKTQLIAEINQRAELEEKKKQLEELLEKTTALIVKNKTLLLQAREAEAKISTLEHCPTCQQDVAEEHKQKIKQQEMQKIAQAELLLTELYAKQEEILQQRRQTQDRLEQMIIKGNLLTKTIVELQQLEEKKKELFQKQEQCRLFVQENNKSMQQLADLEKDNLIADLERRSTQLQAVRDALARKKYLDEQARDLTRIILQLRDNLGILMTKREEMERQLYSLEDCSTLLLEQRKTLLELQQQERHLSIQQAELLTQKKWLVVQEVELEEKIILLTEEKNKLIRYQELHHWLGDYFIELTYTIEKQVMGTIHQLFNTFFQEWFSILIDDENVTSRIDDSFTPIIEQNGYEVSFFNLSGGEKTSAALAYRLALNRVINEVIQEIKTKDLLILDEPTDGFSLEQLDKVREVLDRLHLQQTIIVSHESKIETFVQNIIRVHKQGHVSSVLI